MLLVFYLKKFKSNLVGTSFWMHTCKDAYVRTRENDNFWVICIQTPLSHKHTASLTDRQTACWLTCVHHISCSQTNAIHVMLEWIKYDEKWSSFSLSHTFHIAHTMYLHVWNDWYVWILPRMRFIFLSINLTTDFFLCVFLSTYYSTHSSRLTSI